MKKPDEFVFESVLERAIQSIAWRRRLPLNVYACEAKAFAFMDASVLGTPGLVEGLILANQKTFSGSVGFSLCQPQLEGRVPIEYDPSSWIDFEAEPDRVLTPIQLRQKLMAMNSFAFDKVNLIFNARVDWLLYDDQTEAVAVLAVFNRDCANATKFMHCLNDFVFTSETISKQLAGQLNSLQGINRQFLQAIQENYLPSDV